MDEYRELGEGCEQCGTDWWIVVDNRTEYLNICSKCANMVAIIKQDFVDKFECPECGGLSGKLEENDEKLGVRCNNCGKLHIMLEKKTTVNNRNKTFTEAVADKTPKCPKCKSTSITAGQRGFKLMTGFLGSSKTVNRCANCGYTWKPSR